MFTPNTERPIQITDSFFLIVCKATLATDAVIGTMQGPRCPGTGYVLLHHVFGGVDGRDGAWVYVEGGMGALSATIAASATSLGADIFTDSEVQQILVKDGRAYGVALKSGEEIRAKDAVLSGATPHVTFKKLLTDKSAVETLGAEFLNKIQGIDYTSPVTKINGEMSEHSTLSDRTNPRLLIQNSCSEPTS